MRLQGRFNFTFNIYEDIDIVSTLIPSMMLQPIIENCVRHGIKPLVNKMGNISITILKKDNSIFCLIEDNGVGNKHKTKVDKNIFSEHKSYGIEIVRRRLELLFEKENKDIFY
jgi:LytS/YehU family sensor histidine kinase